MNDGQFTQGYTKELGKADRFKFTLENKTHYVAVDSVTSTAVTINVTSGLQQTTLSIGEEQNFELTGDNYYDLSVKLNKINTTSLKADITIKKIYLEITAVTTTTTPLGVTTTPSATTTIVTTTVPTIGAEMGVSTWVVIIIVIIVIIIAVIGFWLSKKKISY